MRSLYQSPDHYVPSARAICKYGEKIINREILSPVWRWGYSSWGCIGFEAGSGYCIKPLSLWGTSFVGDLGGFMCSCFCISLGPAVGIRVCPGRCIEVSLCNPITIAVFRDALILFSSQFLQHLQTPLQYCGNLKMASKGRNMQFQLQIIPSVLNKLCF